MNFAIYIFNGLHIIWISTNYFKHVLFYFAIFIKLQSIENSRHFFMDIDWFFYNKLNPFFFVVSLFLYYYILQSIENSRHFFMDID